MTALDTLAATWRDEAAMFRRRGQTSIADLLESCAVELEARMRETALEALTLAEAEAESGYSYSALQKMLADGVLPNVGKKGAPRVRRGDLPRKARGERPGIADEILLRRMS